jgi:hypothetical protein
MFSRTISAFILGASMLLSLPSGRAAAEEIQGQFVLVAELEIDLSQLENFPTRVCSRVGVPTAATAAITSRPARTACSASSSCACG